MSCACILTSALPSSDLAQRSTESALGIVKLREDRHFPTALSGLLHIKFKLFILNKIFREPKFGVLSCPTLGSWPPPPACPGEGKAFFIGGGKARKRIHFLGIPIVLDLTSRADMRAWRSPRTPGGRAGRKQSRRGRVAGSASRGKNMQKIPKFREINLNGITFAFPNGLKSTIWKNIFNSKKLWEVHFSTLPGPPPSSCMWGAAARWWSAWNRSSGSRRTRKPQLDPKP